MINAGSPSVYLDDVPAPQGVEDVSPPREARSTDVSKLNIHLPMAITIVGAAIAIAAGVWRIESQVNIITTRIEHERELDVLREKAIDLRFSQLEAKIESSGLRNSNMSLATELQKQKR